MFAIVSHLDACTSCSVEAVYMLLLLWLLLGRLVRGGVVAVYAVSSWRSGGRVKGVRGIIQRVAGG